MTSAGTGGLLLQLLLLLIVMAVTMVSVNGLTCFSCTSSDTPACADPFNATGDKIGRCTPESECVSAKITGGSLCE